MDEFLANEIGVEGGLDVADVDGVMVLRVGVYFVARLVLLSLKIVIYHCRL